MVCWLCNCFKPNDKPPSPPNTNARKLRDFHAYMTTDEKQSRRLTITNPSDVSVVPCGSTSNNHYVYRILPSMKVTVIRSVTNNSDSSHSHSSHNSHSHTLLRISGYNNRSYYSTNRVLGSTNIYMDKTPKKNVVI